MSVIISGLSTLLLTLLCGFLSIPVLKKIKAGQTVLKYVDAHKDKSGTPTMGGLFFIIPTAIVYFMFCFGQSRIGTVAVVIGTSFMTVGFIDDFIKVYFKRNEGLKAYQKIIFQVSISMVAGVFSYVNGLTEFYIPFIKRSVDFGVLSIPFIAFIFIAITNCVNLTDGLDGLAGSVSAVYLICLLILIIVQNSLSAYSFKENDYYALKILSTCLIGGILGFLFFNVNKARVFMGDTGSLSLGGFIGAISIFSLNALFIPILGIMFVISGISVIIQVIYYKKTKKRIFLMSPIHHHFQMKGFTETQITYAYLLITLVMGGVSLAFYL